MKEQGLTASFGSAIMAHLRELIAARVNLQRWDRHPSGGGLLAMTAEDSPRDLFNKNHYIQI
jgi:hypothetical protein